MYIGIISVTKASTAGHKLHLYTARISSFEILIDYIHHRPAFLGSNLGLAPMNYSDEE